MPILRCLCKIMIIEDSFRVAKFDTALSLDYNVKAGGTNNSCGQLLVAMEGC
jgi:hypothetical protein